MMTSLLSIFANHCERSFLGFPTWYKYLSIEHETCEVQVSFTDGSYMDVALIGLALVDIGLRVAALAAIGYVIYGGIQLVIAQGEPDKVKKGRQTIINALIGLVLAMIATGVVTFIGNRIG